MKVKLEKLNENVKLPVYAKTGDAGLDIKATRIESENDYSITYGTDLCIEIPFGYVAMGLMLPPVVFAFVSAIIRTSAGSVMVPLTLAILTSFELRMSVSSDTTSCLHFPNSSNITSPRWF